MWPKPSTQLAGDKRFLCPTGMMVVSLIYKWPHTLSSKLPTSQFELTKPSGWKMKRLPEQRERSPVVLIQAFGIYRGGINLINRINTGWTYHSQSCNWLLLQPTKTRRKGVQYHWPVLFLDQFDEINRPRSCRSIRYSSYLQFTRVVFKLYFALKAEILRCTCNSKNVFWHKTHL